MSQEQPFHKVFPLTLTLPETVCYFQCKEHLDKYVQRYNIKRPKITKTTARKGKTKDSSKKTGRTRKSDRGK